jgi:predicted RNA-binding protein with PIN domain
VSHARKSSSRPSVDSPPLDALPNLSLKGRVLWHFGLPVLENFVEVFHGLFPESFNPCQGQNPRVIFCGHNLRKKLLGRLRKHASPDRFAQPTLSMKQQVLIVDGHSMIFQWPDLTLLHAKRTAVARESLVRMLTGLQDNTDWHVTVVFDGNGVKPTEASCPHGIQVFYSTADQTADTVIERLAAKYSDRYEVTVATDDLMERTTVASFGANSMSAWQLREEIETAGRNLDERLRQLRRH